MNPLSLSLLIAFASTTLVAATAIPLAARTSRRSFVGQGIAETVLTLPLVLPPTVVGYGMVALFGARSPVGALLRDWLGYTLLFRIEAAVLASAVVSFPLLYLPAKAAFRAVDRDMLDTAALLGATRLQTFWHVSVPMAGHGLLAGAALCFARALGEFGATLMVFGWQPGRVTMPIAVYAAYTRGEMVAALPWVLALTAICFLLLTAISRGQGR